MKNIVFYGFLLMVFIMSGCTMRVATYEADRVDQELKGNRGLVKGSVSDIPEPERKKTREMYNIEIELPHMDKESKKLESDLGNKGYIVKKEKLSKKTIEPITEQKRQVPAPVETITPDKPQVVYQKQAAPEEKSRTEERQKSYVVQKGDTLQKISDKMYGTTKKWKKIFEANKNVLKNPDKIKPGQKLIIPLD